MSLDRRTALMALGGLAGAARAAPTRALSGALAADTIRRIDAACRTAVAAHSTAGVVVQVQHAGRPLLARGYGSANLEIATPAAPGFVFRIGSVSKQFAAAGLLALAEDGRLSLDDPLSKALPDFPRAAEVPLRRLLDHTSGINNITQGVIPWVDYSTSQIVDVIKRQTPLYRFTPGTAWAYSNTGFTLAGAVIEKFSGQTLQQFYAERLFARAGMRETVVDEWSEIAPYRAAGYTPAKAAQAGFVNGLRLSWTIPGAAGALRSTAGDLCRWHEALFAGRVLSAASVQQMTTPSRLVDGRLASAGRTAPPDGTQPVQESGLGLELSKVAGRDRVGHWGSIPGFGADMGTFPQVKLTVVTLANTDFGAQVPPRGIDAIVLADPMFRA